MIGVDTNVLVRYVTQDDPKQSRVATSLLESLSEDSPGFISMVTLTELAWVLSGAYDATREEIAAVLDGLLRTRTLQVENRLLVLQALRTYRDGNADLADCLIERSGFAAGCTHTITFDRKAAGSAGMQLI